MKGPLAIGIPTLARGTSGIPGGTLV